MPQQSEQRYLIDKVTSNLFIWNFNSTYKYIPKGRRLRVHVLACATVRWSTDNWETSNEVVTLDSGVGVFFADIPTENLDHSQSFEFTFYWHDAGKEEGKNFQLSIERDKSIGGNGISELLPDRDKIKVFLPS